MNSDTLYLEEREGGRRVEGAIESTAAAVDCPYAPHERGLARGSVAHSLTVTTAPHFEPPNQGTLARHLHVGPSVEHGSSHWAPALRY
jgi:hypothetical protein